MVRIHVSTVLAVAACLGLLAVPAVGQVTMQFPVARDISILGWEGHDGYGDPPVFDKTFTTEEWSNHGFKPEVRGRKFTQHAVMMDWDTDAINAWIAANTNPNDTLSWTLNVYPVSGPAEDVQILTIESLNDWVEGDGGVIDHVGDGNDSSFENFNWSDGTKAATTNFAQTAFKLDNAGDRVLDLENSLPWIDNDTGTGGINDNQYSVLGRADHFSQGRPIPDFQNSEDLLALDLEDASFDFKFATVALDDDLANAILTDPDNRGILFGPMDSNSGSNWQIWTRESTGFQGEIADELPGPMASFLEVTVTPGEGTPLQAGDADMDLDFDQFDLIKVQQAAKYLSGTAATWGEGDWNGAPGGSPGNPPAGNGLFDQLDIVAALAPGLYLTGPYAALSPHGSEGDSQTSIIYNPGTGEVAVDAPSGTELTSINIDSAGGIFTGDAAQNLGGSFDNDADNNIFKATFGGSFGSLSFGNVAQLGLSEEFVMADLSVVGSLAGGGDLGAVDLIYVPEPPSLLLALLGLVGLAAARRRG